jgi:hypothetical protein
VKPVATHTLAIESLGQRKAPARSGIDAGNAVSKHATWGSRGWRAATASIPAIADGMWSGAIENTRSSLATTLESTRVGSMYEGPP